ncbi:MAG: winged helix-turn-helix domain-containing protein [Candidatus Nitrosopolaris sp.]
MNKRLQILVLYKYLVSQSLWTYLEYNPLDIIAMILEALNYERGRLIVNRFLSPDQLRNYLTVLQENCMLVYEEEKQTYKTTNKGMYFLQIYNQVGDLVTPIGI